MSTIDFDDAVELYHQALREFVKGNSKPNQQRFSRRDDVSLANPLGPTVRGWDEVVAVMELAAAQLHDGEITEFERIAQYVTPELACIVEVEHSRARVGDGEEFNPFDLRVTTVLRPEADTWMVVHRHADSITTPRSIESIISH